MPKRPMADGTRLEALQAARKLLAELLEQAVPSEAASLVKQLRETLAEIEALQPAKGGVGDEIARRRAERRQQTAGAARAGERGVDSG